MDGVSAIPIRTFSTGTYGPLSNTSPLQDSQSARGQKASGSVFGDIQDQVILSEDARKAQKQGSHELTETEKKQVEKLEARDKEVRQHEQAHKAAAGRYGGPIKYEYERGPDGKQYAVGGSVPIDISEEPTPEQTIAKMNIVERAANAPAEPSDQDRRVAAQAAQKRQEAQREKQEEDVQEAKEAREAREDQADGGALSAINGLAVQAYQNSANLGGGSLAGNTPQSSFNAIF